LRHFSREDYKERIKKLQGFLAEWKVEASMIENPVDIFYLTGMQLSLGAVIVTKSTARLFVDGRYFQIAQETSPIEVGSLSEADLSQFVKEMHVKQVAFDSVFTSVEKFSKLQKLFSLVAIPSPVKKLRGIKDEKEQKLLRKSALLLHAGFQHIEKKLKTGITEREVALEFEIFCRKEGAEKLSFDPIIAFGPNSAMPHYRSGEAKLKAGDIVLIDIGVVLNHYCSDMTRVLFWKKPDPDLQHMLTVTKNAQKAAIQKCAPGVTLSELDFAARAIMQKDRMEEYFVHHLGHGIGLEVHEFPRVGSKAVDKDLKLEVGMVITIEPGLYIPGKGGVRYEDMILVTEKGCKKLTI
jgi:Xaa-Pro aminopeptidase